MKEISDIIPAEAEIICSRQLRGGTANGGYNYALLNPRYIELTRGNRGQFLNLSVSKSSIQEYFAQLLTNTCAQDLLIVTDGVVDFRTLTFSGIDNVQFPRGPLDESIYEELLPDGRYSDNNIYSVGLNLDRPSHSRITLLGIQLFKMPEDEVGLFAVISGNMFISPSIILDIEIKDSPIIHTTFKTQFHYMQLRGDIRQEFLLGPISIGWEALL